MTKRQQARRAADLEKTLAAKRQMIGSEHPFCGGNKDGLLPFGVTWVTSDGYIAQCVRVAHNVHERGCYIGTARVIGVARA